MTPHRPSDDDAHTTLEEAFEAADDVPTNPELSDTIGAVIARRYGRREVLQGALGVGVVTALFGPAALTAPAAAGAKPAFAFDELAAGVDETHHVADGYEAHVLIRWGDPVLADAPAFDPRAQTADAQRKQFGYNNDYIAFFPLDETGTRGLLAVNHEYVSSEVMFPGLGGRPDKSDFVKITKEIAEVQMAAHGVSIVEIALENARWRTVPAGRYNRRIDAASTVMTVSGPAAGHARLKTTADATGTRLVGTLNNCAGGQTPWGTYLTGEENFHGYFWTDQKDEKGKRRTRGLGGPQRKSYDRYGVPGNWYNWGQHDARFNVDREPNEPNRFGWITEIDPADPSSTPVKHTALGRFRHEGAEVIVNTDGRVVVYSGDDARFDYLYRFVSKGTYRPGDKAANMTLLREGTLSAARFNDDGTLSWLPLVHGQGPLTRENGFESQADVTIDARLAADLLKATPMDRPEDVQPHPGNGKVWVMLTNNSLRKPSQIDKANPRADNRFGHIIEMTAPGANHAADTFTWEIFIKCGDPKLAAVGAQWHPETSASGWFAAPDNCAIDARGRLWIATDRGGNWPRTGTTDGIYALETEGERRGLSKLFFRVPVGAEMCGPCFTPDDETLFVAVQHPAVDGVKSYKPFGRASTFEDPATRWPDFKPDMPPRPAIVAIRKTGGGKIA
ncbi:MAG: PhoX family phosphatase [Hyphomicrobiaceae bacterium]|nr:PhoX family phosphatase [Hyphomicrobiaceae bacterium]